MSRFREIILIVGMALIVSGLYVMLVWTKPNTVAYYRYPFASDGRSFELESFVIKTKCWRIRWEFKFPDEEAVKKLGLQNKILATIAVWEIREDGFWMYYISLTPSGNRIENPRTSLIYMTSGNFYSGEAYIRNPPEILGYFIKIHTTDYVGGWALTVEELKDYSSIYAQGIMLIVGGVITVIGSITLKPKPILASSEIMFCPYCGTQLPYGAMFCPNCGRKLMNISNWNINSEEQYYSQT